MRLDPLDLIVDDASWLERLPPLGAKLVQLRIKDRPESQVRSQIRMARKLSMRFGVPIGDQRLLANSRSKRPCDFVHLGQATGDADIAALRAKNVRFGVSTHDEAELDRALSLSPDYIALGPIYPTLLKKMFSRSQGWSAWANGSDVSAQHPWSPSAD